MLFVLEACLVLLLYLEPPGPFDGDGAFKTISYGFVQHPGFGAALVLCLAVESCVVLRFTDGWWTALAVYGSQVGALGALVCPTGADSRHMSFAITFFVSTLALSALLWWRGRIASTQLLAQASAFVLLSIFMAQGTQSGVGAMEVVYVYFMLNAWVLDSGEVGPRALLLNV